MGSLKRFSLREISDKTGIKTLVTVGADVYSTKKWAIKCGFTNIYSINFGEDLIICPSNCLNDRNEDIENLYDKSEIYDKFNKIDGKKLIYLDVQSVFFKYLENSCKTPAAGKLLVAAIFSFFEVLEKYLRDEDVLIIDGAMIFQNGGFQFGECPKTIRQWESYENLERAFGCWDKTHFFAQLNDDHGYYLLAPHGFENNVTSWVNFLPHDGLDQTFDFFGGVPGVTSISMLRRVHDSRFATRYFVGEGLDVGGGTDSLVQYQEFFPLIKSILVYDMPHGDAQYLHNVPDDSFDFIYSSHCLEHLNDPVKGLQNWIRVTKPGGVLVLQIPDEDLYEQGCWPSRYNSDHKWTFTINKRESWSPVSFNVLDLIKKFEDEVSPLSIALMDHAYRKELTKKMIDQTRTPMGEAAIEMVLKKNFTKLDIN